MKYPKNSKVITKSGIEFKKTKIPKDFALIVDTREATPLFTRIPPGLTIISRSLKHGDYSILGFEDKVCIERKQTSDFLSYIGSERQRTKKKLIAMDGMLWKSLVVETENPYDLPYYSKLTVEHVRAFLISAKIRYGMHIYWSKSKEDIQRYVLDHLVKCYNILREV